MKRGRPVNAVSVKTADRNRYYQQLRLVWRPDLRRCEGQREGCYGRGNEVQHRRGRSARYMLDVSTWSALCRPCHHWATINPDEAKAAGLAESRLSDTTEPAGIVGTDTCRTCDHFIVWALDGNRSVPLEAWQIGGPIDVDPKGTGLYQQADAGLGRFQVVPVRVGEVDLGRPVWRSHLGAHMNESR